MIISTSSQISWIDVCARCLDAMCKALREVQVIRPDPIVKELEISLYPTLVFSC